MSVTEKHVLSSQRVKVEGAWYWQIDLYYPVTGVVKTVLAPEEPTVIVLNKPREDAIQQ